MRAPKKALPKMSVSSLKWTHLKVKPPLVHVLDLETRDYIIYKLIRFSYDLYLVKCYSSVLALSAIGNALSLCMRVLEDKCVSS